MGLVAWSVVLLFVLSSSHNICSQNDYGFLTSNFANHNLFDFKVIVKVLDELKNNKGTFYNLLLNQLIFNKFPYLNSFDHNLTKTTIRQ